MDLKKQNRRVRRANNFLSFFACAACLIALVVTGYYFLGHKDSRVQQWITNIESKFAETEDNVAPEREEKVSGEEENAQ